MRATAEELRRRAGPADRPGPERWLAETGALRVRLANSRADLLAGQRLRHAVFHEELGARAAPAARRARRDFDRFDAPSDHLLTFAGRDPDPVATCRLLMADAAGAPFASSDEFDIAPMLARHPGRRFLEIGRLCVARPWRNRGVAQALWTAIWACALDRGVDVLFGCASFPGVDPGRHGEALALLARHAATGTWEVRALPKLGVGLARSHRGAIDAKRALRALPPLVRGSLRLGARFAPEVAIDAAFGTIDVFVVLPVEWIPARYRARFAPPGA